MCGLINNNILTLTVFLINSGVILQFDKITRLINIYLLVNNII